VKREAEDQHHEAGSRRERDLQRGVGAPGRFNLFLNDNDLAGQRFHAALGGEGAGAAWKFDLDHVGLAESAEL